MRLFRHTLAGATVVTAVFIPVVHLLAIGALVGLAASLFLWRNEVITWACATWGKLCDAMKA